MKKKLIIFRFGSTLPTLKEYPIIQAITEGTCQAVGGSTQFGVISIVLTKFTPKEITELYARVAMENEDSLPVIVWDPSGDTGFNLDPEMFDCFEEINQQFDELCGPIGSTCTLNLDELLDLVNTKGLTNFTDAELKRLKELSK